MASRRGKKHQADPEGILASLQLPPWLAFEAKAELSREIAVERRYQANHPAMQKFRLSQNDLVRRAIAAAQERIARAAAPPLPRDPIRRLRFFGLTAASDLAVGRQTTPPPRKARSKLSPDARKDHVARHPLDKRNPDGSRFSDTQRVAALQREQGITIHRTTLVKYLAPLRRPPA